MSTTAAPATLDLGTRVMRVPAPAAIVIFGASGDLTRRKLMPALFSLADKQLLPPETAIVGFARQEYDDDSFREQMRQDLHDLAGIQDLDDEVWDSFARRIHYMQASFDEEGAFDRLRSLLDDLDAERGIPGNRVSFDLLNYHLDHFNQYDLNIEKLELTDGYNMLVVQTFTNAEAAERYMQVITENRSQFLEGVQEEHYRMMLISLDNFETLAGEQKHNPYYLFYLNHYVNQE